MSATTTDTDRLTFKQAAKLLNRHRQTVYGWWRDGLKVGGNRLHLRTVKEGGRRFTTLAWVQELLAAQQAAEDARRPAPESRAETANTNAAVAAEVAEADRVYGVKR